MKALTKYSQDATGMFCGSFGQTGGEAAVLCEQCVHRLHDLSEHLGTQSAVKKLFQTRISLKIYLLD